MQGTVKVPKGRTDKLYDPPGLKLMLAGYINQPHDPDSINYILEHVEGVKYVFSYYGEFHACNCLSDELCIVIKPKGKAQLWKTGDEDITKSQGGNPKANVSEITWRIKPGRSHDAQNQEGTVWLVIDLS
ncbi:hypothetical protein DFH29DRAFT_1072559 [Suillus ampliporus]|nr:hypothetical protein DFH29DRAFT_1072559 [Suillus ampliporus]